jgi:hypothetical protein
VRARVSRLQKLTLERNAGRIDFIVTDVKTIKVRCNVRDHFIPFRFDSDGNVVSCDRSIALNRKLHRSLTSGLIEKYISLS